MAIIKTEFKPRRGYSNLKKHLNKIDGATAEWGIYEESGQHPEAKMPVSQLMAIHELRKDQWKRPVFKLSAEEYEEQYFNRLSKDLRRYIRMSASGSIQSIESAIEATAKLGKQKAEGIFGNKQMLVPNSAATKARKGHDNPLVDLGVLKKSVKAKVKKRGEK